MTGSSQGRKQIKLYREQRPCMKIPLSFLEIILEIMSIIGLVCAFYAMIRFWPELPATIPKHFGIDGKVDAWGDRSSLYFLLGVNLLLYVGLSASRWFPQYFNYPVQITEDNARRQYQLAIWFMSILKAQVVWLFVYLQWQTIQVALGYENGLGAWLIAVVLVVPLLSLIIYVSIVFKNR